MNINRDWIQITISMYDIQLQVLCRRLVSCSHVWLSIHWWHSLTGLCNLNLGSVFSITEFFKLFQLFFNSFKLFIFSSFRDSRGVSVSGRLVFALTLVILTA